MNTLSDHGYAARPVERGCGRRKPGGIYLECGLSPLGRPLRDFLFCPPIPIDTAELGLAPIGIKLLDVRGDGVFHVVDIVGQEFYPNVADFYEEVKRFGLSRRAAKTTDFSRLTHESNILLAHPRAIIADPTPYSAERITPGDCPSGNPAHRDPDRPLTEMCVGLYWEDVEGGESIDPCTTLHAAQGRCGDRRVQRRLPSFEYLAARRPDGLTTVKYQLGVFLQLPITRIVVIAGDKGEHQAALQTAQQCVSIPVELEQE